jgi:hypothetical protein
MLVDVWALQKNTTSPYALLYGSGNYQALVEVPTGEAFTGDVIEGYVWICIGEEITRNESFALMNQYPTATRLKCETCDE